MSFPRFCLLALPFVVASCHHTPVTTAPLPADYIAYDPPKGNPTNRHEWNNFGPGTVLITSSQSQYSRAHHLIGEEAVAELADLSKASPLEMKRGSTEAKALREAAISFAKGSLSKAGITAELASETTSEYSWGNTWMTQMPVSELLNRVGSSTSIIQADRAARRALRNDQYRIVQSVIFTDALTIKVRDSRGHKVKLEAALTEQQKLNLRSENATIREDEIVFNAPRFAAYCALPRQEMIERRQLRD